MKKSAVSILVSVAMLLSMCVVGFAASIENVEVNLPEIKAEISAEDGEFDAANVSATLDGNALKVSDTDVKTQSAEWIIFVDTSKSISNEHFVAQKKAIASIYSSLGENDKFQLYTFDETVEKILENGVSKEEAEKKINAIVCDGQDTCFYDILDKMISLAKESKCDIVKPVVYTDGVDTISKTEAETIKEELKTSSVPIYGFYASKLDSKTAEAFADLLKISGGEAKSFTVENAANTLSNTKSDIVALTFTAEGAVAANEAGVLSVDLGDGKAITKEVAVSEYVPVTEEETVSVIEDITEEETEADTEEEGGFNILLVIIPVIVIAAAAVAVVLLKKKGGKSAETAENTEAAEGEKKKAPKKKKEEIPEVQFYFVNKK